MTAQKTVPRTEIKTPKLILASTSKYRKELLSRLQIPFESQAPSADEDQFKQSFLAANPQLSLQTVHQLSTVLAELKARSLFDGTNCVIGSDQICFAKDRILGKPKTPEKAFETLQFLSGSSHHLLTAVALIDADSSETWVQSSVLHFRKLSDIEIRNYIEKDNPLDCAGSYKLECAGIDLVESIDSDDWTGIQGLPMISLCQRLRAKGITN